MVIICARQVVLHISIENGKQMKDVFLPLNMYPICISLLTTPNPWSRQADCYLLDGGAPFAERSFSNFVNFNKRVDLQSVPDSVAKP